MQLNTFNVSFVSRDSITHESMSKHLPSTELQQSSKQRSSCYSEAWEEQESLQCLELRKKVNEIEKSQDEMEKKFRKCIQHLQAEIIKNNDINQRLTTQVNALKLEVVESKQDILIINQFIKTNMQRFARSPNADKEKKEPSLHESNRDLKKSSSKQKSLFYRRSPSKLFKSKISIKT